MGKGRIPVLDSLHPLAILSGTHSQKFIPSKQTSFIFPDDEQKINAIIRNVVSKRNKEKQNEGGILFFAEADLKAVCIRVLPALSRKYADTHRH